VLCSFAVQRGCARSNLMCAASRTHGWSCSQPARGPPASLCCYCPSPLQVLGCAVIRDLGPSPDDVRVRVGLAAAHGSAQLVVGGSCSCAGWPARPCFDLHLPRAKQNGPLPGCRLRSWARLWSTPPTGGPALATRYWTMLSRQAAAVILAAAVVLANALNRIEWNELHCAHLAHNMDVSSAAIATCLKAENKGLNPCRSCGSRASGGWRLWLAKARMSGSLRCGPRCYEQANASMPSPRIALSFGQTLTGHLWCPVPSFCAARLCPGGRRRQV